MITPKLIQFHPVKVESTSPFLFRLSLDRPADSVSEELPRQSLTKNVGAPALSRLPHDPMKLSIMKPIIMYEDDKSPFILDGHRRMHAAFTAGLEKIPAFFYPKQISREDILHLVLSNAIEAADLSSVEKIIALYKCSYYLMNSYFTEAVPLARVSISKIPAQIHAYCPGLLGRKVSEDFILRCFEILALSLEELELFHRLNLPVESILPLLELDSEECLWLLQRKTQISVSTAEMRKLSRLLIFGRAKMGFSLKKWAGQLAKSDLPQKNGAGLIHSLRTALYPELLEREKKIAAHIQNMKLPCGIRIKAPENLEGDSFSCYFTFSTSREFRHYMNLLRWAGGDGKIKALLDELNSPASQDNKKLPKV